jgi:hypothetical protein
MNQVLKLFIDYFLRSLDLYPFTEMGKFAEYCIKNLERTKKRFEIFLLPFVISK